MERVEEGYKKILLQIYKLKLKRGDMMYWATNSIMVEMINLQPLVLTSVVFHILQIMWISTLCDRSPKKYLRPFEIKHSLTINPHLDTNLHKI